MPRDFSGPYDLSDMSDEELRALVVQELHEYPNIDADWIEVDVRDGVVTLSGAVGTDAEKQVAEKVVADVIGVERYVNELVVSELHRQELPEAADEAITADREADEQLGGGTDQQSDTAAHLVDDLETQTFGTHDMQEAIQEGATYIPPDRPIPEGYGSEEEH